MQHCLDLAGKAAVPGNTVVYFPLGVYRISKTLQTRAGAGYRIEGVGWLSRIIWSGLPGGTLLQVTDPNGLQVQSLALGGPRGTRTLHQTGTRPSVVRYHHVYGFYDDETKQVWIEFDHLPKGSLVLSDHIDGRIAIRDSSEAEILLDSVMSVQNLIEGRSPTTGFTGILSRYLLRKNHFGPFLRSFSLNMSIICLKMDFPR